QWQARQANGDATLDRICAAARGQGGVVLQAFLTKLETETTRSSIVPRTQTMAAPIGRSTLAVNNRLTRLHTVAIPQPTAKRACPGAWHSVGFVPAMVGRG